MIDIYAPGLLDGIRHVTIRDGNLENTLSGGLLKETGLTRADLAAGNLGAALPASDPATGAVWYLYPPRTGEREVQDAFAAQGYERLFRQLFDHPRYKIWLELYVRQGVRLGAAQAINGQFADGASGWRLPPSGATLAADAAFGALLTLTNTAKKGTAATLDVPAHGEGIYTLAADARTVLTGSAVQVTASCLSADGVALVTSASETPAKPVAPGSWRTRRTAAWCPAGTATIRLGVGNVGAGDVAFRHVTLDFLPIGAPQQGG
jgi:hypothetical protein